MMLNEKQWSLLQKYRQVGYVIEPILDSMWKPAAANCCCIHVLYHGNKCELQVVQDDILQVAPERYVILLTQPAYQLREVDTSVYHEIKRGLLACLFDKYRKCLFGVPASDASDNPATGESSLSWYSEEMNAFRTCILEPGMIIAEPVYHWEPFAAKQTGVNLDACIVLLDKDSYKVSHTSKATAWHRSYETVSRLRLVQDYLLPRRIAWENMDAFEFYYVMKLKADEGHQCSIFV